MSNLETFQRFTELLEARDLNGMQDMFADNATVKGPTVELGKQQIVDYFKTLFTAFPDISFGLTDFEEQGDVLYCVSHEKGTHKGILDLRPFGIPLFLPPTEKTYTMPKTTYTFHIVNGKIVSFNEETVEGGGLKGILSQLGVKIP